MSFQLINAGTTQLCGQKCDNTTLEIDKVKTGLVCADKYKVGTFQSLESTGNTLQNITGSVIVKTTTNNAYIQLPNQEVGCVIYVIHESGGGICHVTGLVSSDVYIPSGSFLSFIKSTGGWVPHNFSVVI